MTNIDRNERRKIVPWPEFKAGAFQDFLLRYRLPEQYNLVYKARAWKWMDVQTRLQIYRQIEQPLAALCKENDPVLDPAKAFPPPPGLEEYEARRGVEDDKPDEEKDIRDVKIDEGSGR